jgi:hypothetical protein
MTKNRESKHVKLNLCFDKEFFDLLQEKADKDYMRVSTWIRWYLKKSLLEKNKTEKPKTENEKTE